MSTKPITTELLPTDQDAYQAAASAVLGAVMTLARLELKRYPHAAASAAWAKLAAGGGALSFTIMVRGGEAAVVGNLVDDDGKPVTELVALNLQHGARAAGEVVH